MKRLYYLFLSLGLSLLPQAAFASQLYNPLGSRSIPQLIGFVIQAVLGITGSLALAMVIWGGFLWLTAGGKPDRITKGRDTLIWAVIGLAVIFAANILATFVINTLGGATAA
ncbi:hypothetical protein COV06_03305 [Candidatus Uhrbacteria bacterium CG10_big_fil_rev_8_21_14_0_10_50_16]|uniref:Conjugal transfer protein TrbC n=1 Tax=Candidatus Uhrbacteria bacterium CG10_big_fil_rev_8_21_14_0_10_50_16 TaxID=1975039 RepID=A0A2H0RLP0_9BACT|nr:MAG: hypothetical protein COV06_03305 [Candidatus Uhrbacteria bacterium CG10_big_fil_rev_8_21_14_0_10_50_16]